MLAVSGGVKVNGGKPKLSHFLPRKPDNEESLKAKFRAMARASNKSNGKK